MKPPTWVMFPPAGVFVQVHTHPQRRSHRRSPLDVPKGYAGHGSPAALARDKLDLFAVLCIETSHYVSFIKHGPGSHDWIFFDSMADRQGELGLQPSRRPVAARSPGFVLQGRATASTSRRFAPAPRSAPTWKCLPPSWPLRCPGT